MALALNNPRNLTSRETKKPDDYRWVNKHEYIFKMLSLSIFSVPTSFHLLLAALIHWKIIGLPFQKGIF